MPEELHHTVKLRANLKKESMAEFIRQCIERGVQEEKNNHKRAPLVSLSKLRFKGGPKDLSKKIDQYLYGS